jgi:hypothetical protein
LELAPGQTDKARSSDKFCFRFWPIERKHVDTINSIFLDNILRSKSIVFHSMSSFTRSLEVYMTDSQNFKEVGFGERHSRISRHKALEKLSVILKALGSDKISLWHAVGEGEAGKRSCLQSIDDVWLEMTKTFLKRDFDFASGPEASHFWQIYCALGMSSPSYSSFRQLTDWWYPRWNQGNLCEGSGTVVETLSAASARF